MTSENYSSHWRKAPDWHEGIKNSAIIISGYKL